MHVLVRTKLLMYQLFNFIFKNKITFFVFLFFIYTGLIIIVVEETYHENYEKVTREYILREIEKLNVRTTKRWHSYDMRIWCDDAELINAHTNGFTCPPIDDITDLTKRKEREKEILDKTKTIFEEFQSRFPDLLK